MAKVTQTITFQDMGTGNAVCLSKWLVTLISRVPPKFGVSVGEMYRSAIESSKSIAPDMYQYLDNVEYSDGNISFTWESEEQKTMFLLKNV